MWTTLLLVGAAAAQDSGTVAVLPPADPAIQAAALSAHVHHLASDAMKGRMTGAPETRAAAEYIATALGRAGIAPAGDDGTYFQRVPLVEYRFDAQPTLTVEETDGSTWSAEHGTQFRLRVRGLPDPSRRLGLRSTADAPGADEAGDHALFVPGRRTEYAQWLEEHGLGAGDALGLLVLEGSSGVGRARPLRGGGLTVPKEGADPGDQVIANARLLEALQAGRVAALTLETAATVEDRSCQNVVGILRGVGTEHHPDLAGQALVLTAHYDHIGHREEAPDEGAEDADTINNGADDDASGVAALLEVAEALGAGDPPARTVVFALVTGEERGLLGTEVYLDDPAVPLASTLYNLNVEMIGRPDPLMPGPGALWLTGWSETTLGPSLAGEGQPVHEDPRPEQNFYQRSDNIAFVRRGVMGQTLSSFGMHTDYHQVSDEPDTLDYEHMELATKNVLRVVRALAHECLPVAWGTPLGEDAPEDEDG